MAPANFNYETLKQLRAGPGQEREREEARAQLRGLEGEGWECKLPAKILEVSFQPRWLILLSAAPSPRSKLLLGPLGGVNDGGGGGGGGCWGWALSPAVKGRRGTEAGASERRAPPRSLPVPWRPARLARSRLPPLQSRGIVFPRPPPPPRPGLGHATFSRLPPLRRPPTLLFCLRLSAKPEGPGKNGDNMESPYHRRMSFINVVRTYGWI
ncbi:uncharacterized protein LOC143651407 [Tamandua tetradactyla]|uniref:uncharacterized protein LOC143651407 n=1 Tax=Tamandua tetradactyla TaxID=48850 RepID=UPI00405399D2